MSSVRPAGFSYTPNIYFTSSSLPKYTGEEEMGFSYIYIPKKHKKKYKKWLKKIGVEDYMIKTYTKLPE